MTASSGPPSSKSPARPPAIPGSLDLILPILYKFFPFSSGVSEEIAPHARRVPRPVLARRVRRRRAGAVRRSAPPDPLQHRAPRRPREAAGRLPLGGEEALE